MEILNSKLVELRSAFADDNVEDDEDENPFPVRTAPSIKMLCLTRWTVRGEDLRGILSNYGELKELWDWAIENTSDPTMKGRLPCFDPELLS